MRNQKQATLVESVIKGMLEKKAAEVVMLDFNGIEQAVCDRFVICHGHSGVHVQAIAEAVEAETMKMAKSKPIRREGVATAQWILLDYFDVVVHIFQEQPRQFYALEKLWGDATVQRVES